MDFVGGGLDLLLAGEDLESAQRRSLRGLKKYAVPPSRRGIRRARLHRLRQWDRIPLQAIHCVHKRQVLQLPNPRRAGGNSQSVGRDGIRNRRTRKKLVSQPGSLQPGLGVPDMGYKGQESVGVEKARDEGEHGFHGTETPTSASVLLDQRGDPRVRHAEESLRLRVERRRWKTEANRTNRRGVSLHVPLCQHAATL